MNEEFEQLLHNLASELIDYNDQITGLIGQTNASLWGLDYVDNLKLWTKGYKRMGFSTSLTLAGEQDEDRFFYGDRIDFEVQGEINKTEERWEIYFYEIKNVQLS